MGVCRGKGVESGLAMVLVLMAGATRAQQGAPDAGAGMDAQALVRRGVAHRLEAEKSRRPMEYLLHRVDERRDTTKAIIETRDGDVARLVAEGGKPLSAEADRAELDRLENLEAHPELQEHRKRGEQKDEERIERLMAMLPDAFAFRMEGVEPCAAGRCYRLSFAPNAKWQPPDMESRLFRGMAGEVWISQAAERLVRLDARFIADVDFGFGILGKLNQGGTVSLEQTEVGGGDWELTGLTLHVTGRALVKSLSFQVREETSHYVPVTPGMGYGTAIEMLKKFRMDAGGER